MSAPARSARGTDPGGRGYAQNRATDHRKAIHGCRTTNHQRHQRTSRTSLTDHRCRGQAIRRLTASTRSHLADRNKADLAPGRFLLRQGQGWAPLLCKTRTTRTPSTRSCGCRTWSRTRTRHGHRSADRRVHRVHVDNGPATCEGRPSVAPPTTAPRGPHDRRRVPQLSRRGPSPARRARGNGCRKPGSDRVADHVRRHGYDANAPLSIDEVVSDIRDQVSVLLSRSPRAARPRVRAALSRLRAASLTSSSFEVRTQPQHCPLGPRRVPSGRRLG